MKWKRLHAGVPQGSVFWPPLFLIFIIRIRIQTNINAIGSRIINLNDDTSPEAMKSLDEFDGYISFLNMYIGYRNLSLARAQGSTAQYWMMYVKAVNHFLMFHSSCRTNNIDLFIYPLSLKAKVFFVIYVEMSIRSMSLTIFKVIYYHTHMKYIKHICN